MRPTGDCDGLRVLITGGGAGIGLATGHAFLARGAGAVSVLDRDPAAAPDPMHRFGCDLSDDGQVRAAVAAASRAMGGIDVVVNNAGTAAVGDITANPDDEWHRVLDVNVLGMVRVTRAALPWLRESQHAAVVNLGSIAAWLGLPQRALYSASKGAVQALTLAMAADHLADGIRVNCVNPGTADTPWVQRLIAAADDPAAELAALQARQPHGRLVSPDEIAAAICYLASPLAGSTTGAVLGVDAGMHALRPRPSAATGATGSAATGVAS